MDLTFEDFILVLAEYVEYKAENGYTGYDHEPLWETMDDFLSWFKAQNEDKLNLDPNKKYLTLFDLTINL